EEQERRMFEHSFVDRMLDAAVFDPLLSPAEVPEQSFKHVASLAGGPGQLDSLVPATALSELPEGDVRMSAPLPSCYAWASAMRVTSSRGVCSVYAWRARRLLTLDLEADPEDDCDDDEAVD
ncbi:unnamed protein product, partial [Prorocentrum cordatum]